MKLISNNCVKANVDKQYHLHWTEQRTNYASLILCPSQPMQSFHELAGRLLTLPLMNLHEQQASSENNIKIRKKKKQKTKLFSEY